METQWRTTNTDSSIKTYSYSYDALNRIRGAIDNTGHYNLGGFDGSGNLINPITYDKNGNIITLQRQGHTNAGATLFGTMDNLVYTYDSGNKLTKVLDNGNDSYGFVDGANTTNEYTYDANGNMNTDANKGITGITYNYLNLPTQVTLPNGIIQYIYDAAGIKLQKIVNETSVGITTTDYAGNYIYENSSLKFFGHAEGYVDVDNGNKYVYQYKDHLGNVRLTYADSDGNGSIDPSIEIISEKHYYPFGMLQKGYNNVVTSNANSVAEKFQYNGKEIDEDLGLNWHDYGARRYDASLGRFMTLDPFAEKYSPQSVYAYAANNPIMYVDVFGMGPGDPPYTKNNVTFIHFDAPTISVVNRQSGGTFTSAAIATDNSSVSNEYVVNMQQYETLTYKAKLQYVAGSNIDVGDLQTQGLTIVNGEVQEGGRTSNSYYVAQCADGSCQAGLGNPPADSKVGFGGGIPLIVDGMAYGETKKYDSDGKMIQNSSAGFKFQNNKTVGKTILAFDNDGNFMIVSQQNGVEGMTLDGIRDHLISKGYTNAISFDGSTSATLVKDNKVINQPDKRKDNSIPVGARINE